MKTDHQVMLLRDAAIEPTAQVLENVLGPAVYPVYSELLKIITDELGLQYEWRYYTDGKAWLFKAVHKKKTIFWLSIWEGFFKTSFFFTEKTRPGVVDLAIADTTKEDFAKSETTGRLIPLILDIDKTEQLPDFREIAGYKKNLK